MRNDSTKLLRLAFAFLLLVVCKIAVAQEPPAHIAGTWTISSTGEDGQKARQTMTLRQNGNQITGHFKGPHQSGGVSGVVNGNHVYFLTKTHEELNFRGMVEGNTMHGTFGIRGRTGVFTATRSSAGAN